MEARLVKSFYRVTKSNPPSDADYVTRLEREGKPPAHLPEDVKESWNAYSAFDSPEGALAKARRFKRLGRYIMRYDIPERSGISWEQTIEPGHYDLRGDKELLKQFLIGCIDDV